MEQAPVEGAFKDSYGRQRRGYDVQDQPKGTVTFLFTDIEASTRAWEHNPRAMEVALARHNALIAEAFQARGGYIFKTVGDAFCAAFATPHSALGAAIDAQRSLHSASWGEIGELRVRMALHTGATNEREGDYVGPVLNRVARLLSAAHGGQVLLTQATRELVLGHLPEGIQLRDMGEHRLRDLINPEHIFQVVIEGLPSDFPPLRTQGIYSSNLPLQATTFVGRKKELAALLGLLQRQDVRLLTLLGPPGIGKTRLSVQAAEEISGSGPVVKGQEPPRPLTPIFNDGVFFVPLAPVSDPLLVPATIASVFNLKQTGQPPLEDLKDYLRDKELLLLLDNFEQITPAATALAELLATCPRLKMLVTSRTVLHIYGEHIMEVPPLQLPAKPQRRRRDRAPATHTLHEDLQSVAQYDAVQLFLERASSVRGAPLLKLDTRAVAHGEDLAGEDLAGEDLAGEDLAGEDLATVAEICRRVEGLPLAIELAAARSNVLSPSDILAHLDNRLKLLTGGARNLPARQRTLRGAIDWSYDLLDEREKALFCRLSVFVGGCTLDAIVRLLELERGPELATSSGAGRDEVEEVEVLDVLASLVDKSLVRWEDEEAAGRRYTAGSGQVRYTMLETIKEYASERLAEQERADAPLQRAHALYFVSLVEEAEPHLTGPERERWLEMLDAEVGNLRAALDWSLSAEAGARKKPADSSPKETVPAELALRLAGALPWFWHFRSYVVEGRQWLDRSLARADRTQRTVTLAKALYAAGHLAEHYFEGRSALPLLEESVSIFRELGDRRRLAYALVSLGMIDATLGFTDGSRFALVDEAITLFREVGDKWGLAYALHMSGNIAYIQGNFERAVDLERESLSLYTQLGDKWNVAYEMGQVGMAAILLGNYSLARSYFDEAMLIDEEVGDEWNMAVLLRGRGVVAYLEGEYDLAASFYDESALIYRELGDRARTAAVTRALGHVACRQERYEEALRLHREALSLHKELGITWGVCLDLAGVASAAAALGQPERAAWLLGAAIPAGKMSFMTASPVDVIEYERNVADLRAQLGDARFEQGQIEGSRASLERAISASYLVDAGSHHPVRYTSP